MVEAKTGGGADANKVGDDMTGITNKAGRSGCDHCGAANHWKATCPHKGKTAEEMRDIRAKNSAGPQLVEVADTTSKKKRKKQRKNGERKAWPAFPRQRVSWRPNSIRTSYFSIAARATLRFTMVSTLLICMRPRWGFTRLVMGGQVPRVNTGLF